MRRLTGGVPRTMILLYEIFLDESANVFEDLEVILDKVTQTDNDNVSIFSVV